MAKGQLFAKAHYKSKEDIESMVDLVEKTPGLDGLDVVVFREVNGKQLPLEKIGEIIDGKFSFSLEYGDTDDTQEVIDFLNPAKKYMEDFVYERLIPIANKTGCQGINFHLVGKATNLTPGEVPSVFFDEKKTHLEFGTAISYFEGEADCPITAENVHPLSTRLNVDKCIKFSPIGNKVQDLFNLNRKVILDLPHFAMTFFTYQYLYELELKGQLKRGGLRTDLQIMMDEQMMPGFIPDPDFVWCPTQLSKRNPSGPYLVKFGSEEKAMVLFLPDDLTEAVMRVLGKLWEKGQGYYLEAIHLANIKGPSKEDPFNYWDNEGGLKGAFDLPRILKYAYYDLGLKVVAEVNEINHSEPKKPEFRKNLLQVVEMLKS